uniref:Uncharacterized protein n=1 Tax=Kalanchoe fedtschenkoi TaxID=63787 RepID=A0A7N0UZI1_KALFE
MGCCLSRDRSRSVVKQQPLSAVKSSEKELETVKEILSLTPTHPATKHAAETDVPEPDPSTCVKAPELELAVEYETSPELPNTPKIEAVVAEEKSSSLAVAGEVSDASECGSFTESRSTTTVTEIGDEIHERNGTVSSRGSTLQLQRVARPSNRPQRATSGAVSYTKPRRESNQSPSRRPEPRRAVGESHVRRTLSPGSRRVSGPRPIRSIRPGPSSPNGGGHGRMEESLENPLVSLECFIFL